MYQKFYNEQTKMWEIYNAYGQLLYVYGSEKAADAELRHLYKELMLEKVRQAKINALKQR